MIKHRADSIQQLNDEHDLFRIYPYFPINGNQSFEILYIELLKGCIMELADVVYGDGGEVTA